MKKKVILFVVSTKIVNFALFLRKRRDIMLYSTVIISVVAGRVGVKNKICRKNDCGSM